MTTYQLITPKGTKDILLEECEAKRWIEARLRQVYTGYGYNEVVTPGIEFLDVFQAGVCNPGSENMFKLIDNEGRILVLRPDSTAPIARMVSTRLKNSFRPIRLFYNQRVYRQKGMYSGKSTETSQMGVELIGANTAKTDLEVIAMATEALESCCQQEYRIEIGHCGFFEALISRLQADDNQKEQIRLLIGAKNYAALNDLLDTLGQGETAAALKLLPRLFGGAEVFDAAGEIFEDAETKKILDNLRWIYYSLIQMGLKKSVMLDLGFVNDNNYYTGVIFQGYIQGTGEAVLSGGRYDQLLSRFGDPMPAIGFGINVDTLTKLRLTQNLQEAMTLPQILVYGEPGYEVLCLQYAQTLRQQPGMIVENALLGSKEACLAYAVNKGIPKVHVVGQTIEIINVETAGGARG